MIVNHRGKASTAPKPSRGVASDAKVARQAQVAIAMQKSVITLPIPDMVERLISAGKLLDERLKLRK